MMFQIIDFSASVSGDLKYWRALPPAQRDVHFDPGYSRAYMADELHPHLCALTEDGDGYVMQPFVIRGDAAGNAYGYGGMVGHGSLMERHRDNLLAWLSREGLKLCYRFHPLVGSAWPDATREKEIVWMDLTRGVEDGLRKGHASSVAKARRNNVAVAEERSGNGITKFIDMYHETMDRIGAGDWWYWGEQLLYRLISAFPDGSCVLLARVDGNIEAGCFLLGSGTICYYHYAGSRDRHRGIGVGNLLVVEAALWAKRKGFSVLHLGGGTTADPDDSLLRFKSGFSKRRAWVYRFQNEGKNAEKGNVLARC